MKLLNNDERRSYSNNFPSTSAASTSHQNRRNNPRISNNHHKRFSLNENSIDADNMDVSFAFPHDFDKYSDDIWRKTVSSDCDQSIQVWEKQPEPMASWGAASSRFYEPTARSARLFDDDIFSTGGNYFFPTSGTSGASTSSSARRLTTADSKPSNRSRKNHGTKIPSMSNALDSDDEFQTIKKRLSLSSLRNSLCRQKALENLNNENNQGASSSSANNPTTSVISGSNDDFLQVFIILFYFIFSL